MFSMLVAAGLGLIGIKLKRNMASINEISKRNQRKPKVTSTRPAAEKRPQPTPRISGASSPRPIRQHISGR